MNNDIEYYIESIDLLNEGLFHDKVMYKPSISSKDAYDKCIKSF